MKTLISIGSIAVSSLALNLILVQQAQAIDLGFTSATTTTEAFYGSINYSGSAPVVGAKTFGGWTSEGYNMLVSNGANLATNSNVAAEDGSAVNFYGSALPAPVGTHFVAADSAYLSGRIYQDLTGLEIGATYTISYYQAAAQQYLNATDYNGATTDNWIANVGGTYIAPTYDSNPDPNYYGGNLTTGGFTGGTTHESPTMSLASKGNAGTQTVGGATAPTGWHQDSFSFTATNTTEKLSFLAKGAPNGKPPFALLAGVSANKIPEPADYVGTLVGFGFAGLAIKSRLAKKKLDDRN
jgi:hypothetical protein